jgi:hypothetical protein
MRTVVPDQRNVPGIAGEIRTNGASTRAGIRPTVTIGSENTIRISLASSRLASLPLRAGADNGQRLLSREVTGQEREQDQAGKGKAALHHGPQGVWGIRHRKAKDEERAWGWGPTRSEKC